MPEEIQLVIHHPGAYKYATASSIKAIKQKYRTLVETYPCLREYAASIQSSHIRPDGTKDSFVTTHTRKPGDIRWTSLWM